MYEYHKIPGPVIWAFHIFIGVVLLYSGITTLQRKPLPLVIGILFALLGLVAPIYHSYLWFKETLIV
jgi:hypothetical protein